MKYFIFSIFVVFGFGAQSQEIVTHPATMNDLRLKDYKDFKDKWKLVTVRFRTDSGEQRFTYANPLAEKALESGAVDYPDGAVFAKIGIKTKEDPAFLSSKVPSGVVRYQLMVRDKKKYKETDGWGYALFFGTEGDMTEKDPVKVTQACHACHKLVPERGFVFSQMMWNKLRKKPVMATEVVEPKTRLTFETKKVSVLPVWVKNLFSPEVTEVQFVTGDLREMSFSGTFDEISPELKGESIRTGRPALLLGLKDKGLSVMAQERHFKKFEAGTCAVPEPWGRVVVPPEWIVSKQAVKVQIVCEP